MKERLVIIFTDWEKKLEKDEWYFIHSFEEISDGLSPTEAFENIPEVITVLLTSQESFLIGETLDFLQEIYNLADTTEVHPYLKNHHKQILTHLHTYADSYGVNAYKELLRVIRFEEEGV